MATAVETAAEGIRQGRIAPWYLAYLILGLLTAGLLPFLLPLMVAGVSHRPREVAYVSGAYNLGLLGAPFLGRLAERRHVYRPVFFGGFFTLGVAFALFPFAGTLAAWFLLALAIGLATGAAATVATLFIVNFAPRREWEPRLGWLQSFNGAGQFAGLLVAGLVAGGAYVGGFILASALAFAAIVLGGIGLPPGARQRLRGGLSDMQMQALLSATQLGPGIGGLLRHSHRLHWRALLALHRPLRGAFGRFLLAWAAYNFGVAAFFAYYPLLMRRSYGIPAPVTAFAYAAAAGIGIFLFVAAGRLTGRYGGEAVFRAGLALRLAGFVLLALPFAFTLPGLHPLPAVVAASVALLGFALAMMAWPVLSVSGTALAAGLTPISEGAAIGLLNASGALAMVAGTFLGGPMVRLFGYASLPPLAIAGLAASALLMSWRVPTPEPGAPAAAETAG
jgi:MFS family permease